MPALLKEKQDIKEWLREYKIKNYELIENDKYGYVVDVPESVRLHDNKLKHILVKFNHIKGAFNCSDNILIDLQGAPEIVESYFHCANNRLNNLKNCPKYVHGHFYCDNNDIEHLEFLPENIGGHIDLIGNMRLGNFQLTTDFQKLKTLLEAQKLSAILQESRKIHKKFRF